MNSNLHKKAYFLSRRGLQELDLILKPFVEQQFEGLSKTEKEDFLDLLDNNDIDLIDWILSGKSGPTKFSNIIHQIKAFTKNERE